VDRALCLSQCRPNPKKSGLIDENRPRSPSELVSWDLENVASELPETKIALSFSVLPLMLITLSWINKNQRFWVCQTRVPAFSLGEPGSGTSP